SREILSCAVGGWFGRTLPDSECQETVTRDDGSTYVRFLDATERPGCGVCTQAARVGFTCQAPPADDGLQYSCNVVDLRKCTQIGIDSILYEGSIPLSRREY